MRATLRTIYGLIVLSILFVLAMTPFSPVEAATAGPAIAAGGRAMQAMDATHQAWLRTLPARDQQLVICAQLARAADDAGLVALDCNTAAARLSPNHVAYLAADWERFLSGAAYGYVVPTANDVAKAEPQARAAVHRSIACSRIRDRIAVQIDLMRRGSTGYWNMDTMRTAEAQYCGDTLAVAL